MTAKTANADKNTTSIWGRSGVDIFAARLLMVSFLLPEQLQALAVMATGLYFVVRSVAAKTVIPRSNYLLALAIGSIYLLTLFSLPFTPPEYRDLVGQLCQRRASLLLMPFAFAIISPHYRTLIMGQIFYFVYACLAVCILFNADFLYHYFFATQRIHTLSHVQYRVMFEQFTDTHPTYMGMFLAFSICITTLLYPAHNTRAKAIKYGAVYLLLVFLLSLLAKSPLIALVLIGIHYAYVHRKVLFRYKLQLFILLVAVAAACYFIPFIGQRVQEIFQFARADKSGNVTNNSVYVRQMIWNTETGLLKEHWVTGVGPGQMQQMLNERYAFYATTHHVDIGFFDPHDQYISDWLSFGIIGIVLLLAVLIIQFIKAIRTGNTLYLYLLIILAITSFTETVLSRQRGVLFYAVFTSLLFFYSQRGKQDASR